MTYSTIDAPCAVEGWVIFQYASKKHSNQFYWRDDDGISSECGWDTFDLANADAVLDQASRVSDCTPLNRKELTKKSIEDSDLQSRAATFLDRYSEAPDTHRELREELQFICGSLRMIAMWGVDYLNGDKDVQEEMFLTDVYPYLEKQDFPPHRTKSMQKALGDFQCAAMRNETIFGQPIRPSPKSEPKLESASSLAEQWNAQPSVGRVVGVIKAISDAEVIQHAGQGKHVVWARKALSGLSLVVGKRADIDRDGKVRKPNERDNGLEP